MNRLDEMVKVRRGEGMTDRDVLQALLDGKVIKQVPCICGFLYRLNGKWMEIKYGKHEWDRMDHIPELDSDHVRIVEVEE